MRNTRQITQAAMMIGIVALIQLLNMTLGGFFTNLLPVIYPIPYVIYSSQNKLGASLAMYFASLVVLFMLSSLPQFLLIAMYAIIGVFFGQGVRKRLVNYQLLIVSSLFITLINVVSVYLFGSFFGINLHQELISLIELFPSLSYELASVVYYGIILLTSVLEAILIYMVSTILFAYLKLKNFTRIHWYEYPLSIKETMILVSLVVACGLLYVWFRELVYLLIMVPLVLWLLFIGVVALTRAMKKSRK